MVKLSEIKSLSFSFRTTSKTKREQSTVGALLRKKTEQLRSLIAETFSKKSDPKGLQAPWVHEAMTHSFEENVTFFSEESKLLPTKN